MLSKPEMLAEHLFEHIATARAVEALLPQVEQIAEMLCAAFDSGRTLYTIGNGGSAADAQHLAAEFIGRYRCERRPLPAVALTCDPSVMTCISNDYRFNDVFARQITALAHPGDVVVGFTTSGRSTNLVSGLSAARATGATTVLFAAGDGASAAAYADHALLVPSGTAARVQEMHVLLLHLLSELVDTWVTALD